MASKMVDNKSNATVSWVLYGYTPKIGQEEQFKFLEEAFIKAVFNASLTMLQKKNLEHHYRNEIEKISKTPYDFVTDLKKEDLTIDAGRILTCEILPQQLRNRAGVDQTAIEAIDYGSKLMQAVRSPLVDLKREGGKFGIERDLNFIRNTAQWLLTWGKRGFGYFVIR